MIDERYSRQILFREIGSEGQRRLLSSTVLIVGCGALGASHAEMLARAGVGQLRIVDRDFVEFTNLQRQTLFSEKDAAERIPKAIAARQRLLKVNSGIEIEAFVEDVNLSNVERLIEGCDIVIDGTDNFQVRYLLNDACVKHNVPWVYGAAVSSYGTTMTVIPGETPCLRCIFEEMPDAGSSPTCDTAGVIMPIIATVSAVQVSEVLKYLVGDREALHRSLMQFDIWANDRQRITLAGPEPSCVCCGERRFTFLDAEAGDRSAILCGRNAVQIAPPRQSSLNLKDLAEKLSRTLDVRENEYLVRFNAGEQEITVFRDARAVIKGTDDLALARSLYDRYIGT